MSAVASNDWTIRAKHAGICPICARGIVPGRSFIAPLAVGTPPNPERCRYDAARRTWHVNDDPAGKVHRRSWAHRACQERWQRKYPAIEDQLIRANEWKAELAAHKADAIRNEQLGRNAARRDPRGRHRA